MEQRIGLGLLLVLAGCDAGPQPRPPQSTQPATQTAEILTGEQLEYARRPITYFNEKCGKCHGNYGSYWLEGVIAGLGERKLREEVDLMAAGPSRAPLEGLALGIQVAYHRSLADGRPFVTVFRDQDGLAGEVTPGSRVLLLLEGREQEAEVSEHRWKSNLRDASSVRVTKDSVTTELTLQTLRQAQNSTVEHSHPPPRD